MATKNETKSDAQSLGRPHKHGPLAGAVAGEALGAVLGSAAGPVGVVAGVVLGGAMGALTGKVIDQEDERRSQHDAELDEIIGVTHGDLGRPNMAAKPSR